MIDLSEFEAEKNLAFKLLVTTYFENLAESTTAKNREEIVPGKSTLAATAFLLVC